MAIIYSYPTKTTPVSDDMILITDSESTNPVNQTKQVSISSIQGLTAGVSKIIAGSGITIGPVSGVGEVTITASGDAYTLKAEPKAINLVPLKLDAATGTDSTVNIKEGANITLTRNSETEIEIAASGTTYSAMTDTTLGLGKLRYTTGATPAAEAQSVDANRTYGITENASNQLVVNVPWADATRTINQGSGVTVAGSDPTWTISSLAPSTSSLTTLGLKGSTSGTVSTFITNNATVWSYGVFTYIQFYMSWLDGNSTCTGNLILTGITQSTSATSTLGQGSVLVTLNAIKGDGTATSVRPTVGRIADGSLSDTEALFYGQPTGTTTLVPCPTTTTGGDGTSTLAGTITLFNATA